MPSKEVYFKKEKPPYKPGSFMDPDRQNVFKVKKEQEKKEKKQKGGGR
jgi:hypothetical protein